MFSLDGPLRYIPIAALQDGDGWLAQKYSVIMHTEAVKNQRRIPSDVKKWRAIVLGYTYDVPEMESSLKSIVNGEGKGIFPGFLRLNGGFTKDALINALDGKFSLVHLATHFNFAETMSESYLLLGDAKPLTLENIKNEPLSFDFKNVEQLTFSACSTAMVSGDRAGREVESLGVLAQRRGAKSVMATLWDVDASATSDFMPYFYRFRKEDRTAAEALRKTQAKFIEGRTKGNLRHPYFWAPFILMGNWL
jgi:CHAT domain-containing protein